LALTQRLEDLEVDRERQAFKRSSKTSGRVVNSDGSGQLHRCRNDIFAMECTVYICLTYIGLIIYTTMSMISNKIVSTVHRLVFYYGKLCTYYSFISR
uniref:Vesicle transport protein n=1 Tax=Brugia timori TaxID=42155 RepID=A0A0R3Q8S4_9BILA